MLFILSLNPKPVRISSVLFQNSDGYNNLLKCYFSSKIRRNYYRNRHIFLSWIKITIVDYKFKNSTSNQIYNLHYTTKIKYICYIYYMLHILHVFRFYLIWIWWIFRRRWICNFLQFSYLILKILKNLIICSVREANNKFDRERVINWP